jgi:hypothetical protein
VLLLRIEWVDERRQVADHVTYRPKTEYRRILTHEGDMEFAGNNPIYDVPRTLPGPTLPGLRGLNNLIQQLTAKRGLMKQSEDERLLTFTKSQPVK